MTERTERIETMENAMVRAVADEEHPVPCVVHHENVGASASGPPSRLSTALPFVRFTARRCA